MFATPLWLAALAALGIPLALHLWSRRPRQMIRVGTLRHLGEVPPARARSARLSEPLLLLLRLLILAAIVLALAGPRIRGATHGRPARLLLVDPALLADPLLDSLNAARATIRLLVPGLPEHRLPLDPAKTAAPPLALWEALRQADRLVTDGGTLEVYARPRIARLGAVRPRLRSTVRWHSPDPEATSRWLVGLTAPPGGGAEALIGAGNASGIEYSRLRGSDPAAVSLAAGRTPAPPVPRRLHVPGADTSRRLGLAIRAVNEELGQGVTLAPTGDATLDLPPHLLAAGALADSVLARWPWRAEQADTADPREVSIAAALPQAAVAARVAPLEVRTRELLLLAGLLLLGERWLARRPRRSAA
jgi:hypothetical protein